MIQIFLSVRILSAVRSVVLSGGVLNEPSSSLAPFSFCVALLHYSPNAIVLYYLFDERAWYETAVSACLHKCVCFPQKSVFSVFSLLRCAPYFPCHGMYVCVLTV